MVAWIYLGLVLVAIGALAGRARRARLRGAARERPAWGVPHVAEGDPYADEYWRFAHAATESRLPGVDDRTWGDLDIDTVLRHVDRTRSTLGRQTLYARLRWGTEAPRSDRLETLAAKLANNAPLRADVLRVFDALDPRTGQGFWRITMPRAIELRPWYYVFPVLTTITAACAVATIVSPSYVILLGAALVLNLFARAATARQLIAYRGAFGQVAPILNASRRLHEALSKDDAEVDGDLAALAPLRRPAKWMSRDAYEVGELAATAYEYLNVILVIDANALLAAAASLERSRESLIRVSTWVGDVDLAMSIAALRAEARPWTVPLNSDARQALEVTGAWHPMLPDPVPNSVTLNSGSGMIVTGSNMSGKSTFLRTLGVCVVLANGLRTVPATSFRSQPIRVRTCIGRADSLAEGRSYYITEVETVLGLLRTAQSHGNHLFLFDELFRGTNTIERIAAAEAVLHALVAGYPGASSCVVVATHDAELVSLLADDYRPVHFEEQTAKDGISFDYRLRPGPATTRSAITLLELYGAPEEVVDAARRRADMLTALQARRT